METTYSEIFSNAISVPRAWLAASASSSPDASMGPRRYEEGSGKG